MVVVGIDLGTTNSCIAVWRQGCADVIPDPQGRRIVPSAVAMDDHDIPLIGTATCHLGVQEFTVRSVKRVIGQKWDEVSTEMGLLNYTVIRGVDEKAEICIGEKSFKPEEISSLVLKHLKQNAEGFLGETVKSAVVTVPAYFNDGQRHATRKAAELAGFNVLRIINEPTAAALAYGMDLRGSCVRTGIKTILVFDLGGGTCDVSVLEMDLSDGLFEVKATIGDGRLGGDDWDSKLVEFFAVDFERKHRESLRGNARALRRLRNAAEKAKRILSFTLMTDIDIDCLLHDIDYHIRVSRALFESICEDLFSRCSELVESIFEESIQKCQVDEVVLVGGSTRMPKVKKIIENLLSNKVRINDTVNPEEVVACGAAIYAAMLANEDESLAGISLQDVTPLGFGIETAGGLMTCLVPRNSPIPCTATLPVTTYAANQKAARIKVYQGERAVAGDNFFVGEFTLSGLPSAKRSELRIDITLRVDEDGCLVVKASGGGTSERLRVKPQEHTTSAIETALKDATTNRQADEMRREAIELRHQLENMAWAALDGNDEAAKEPAGNLLEWLELYGAVADVNALLTRRALFLGGRSLPVGIGRALPATEKKLQLEFRRCVS